MRGWTCEFTCKKGQRLEIAGEEMLHVGSDIIASFKKTNQVKIGTQEVDSSSQRQTGETNTQR